MPSVNMYLLGITFVKIIQLIIDSYKWWVNTKLCFYSQNYMYVYHLHEI
jgi:hypothetical protein